MNEHLAIDGTASSCGPLYEDAVAVEQLLMDIDESDVATVKRAILGFDFAQLDTAARALKRQREFLRKIVIEGKGREGREKVKQKLHDHLRKAVTGDIHIRVRDHIRDKAQEPLVVRLLDKVAFTFGVLNIVISEAVLLLKPEKFWIWYTAIIPTLIAVRYPYYRRRKWQYFLLDFCYFVHMFCMMQLYVFPNSCIGNKLTFLYSNGPLVWAIPSWRNSLVFHDMEKTTSVYIHFFPVLLTLCMRWYVVMPPAATSCIERLYIKDFVFALVIYALWQFVYFIKTEIVDKPILEADPALKTSLRWLSMDHSNAMNRGALRICRTVSIMGQDELFNPDQLKTKIIFMVAQLAFTVVTMLPVPIFYSSYVAHSAFVLLMFGCAVWNAGNFYIEVFARRYWNDLELKGLALKERRLLREPSSSRLGSQNSDSENEFSSNANCARLSNVTMIEHCELTEKVMKFD